MLILTLVACLIAEAPDLQPPAAPDAAGPGPASAVSCSSCTDNGDGTVTLHVFPPSDSWSARTGAFDIDVDGLFNANHGSTGMEIESLLEVEPGDLLTLAEVVFDAGGTFTIQRDPPAIDTQGSTPLLGGGNATTGGLPDAWELSIVVEPDVDYYAVVWLSPEAGNSVPPPSHLQLLDVTIELAP